jgi:renalase
MTLPRPSPRKASACATGSLQFDHGAQYINVHGAGFAAVLRALGDMNALAGWQDGTGRSHSVGVPGKPAIPKALGAWLDIRQHAQVARIVQDQVGWVLHLDDASLRAARVVVTIPGSQVGGCWVRITRLSRGAPRYGSRPA